VGSSPSLLVISALALAVPALAQPATKAPKVVYTEPPKEGAKESGWKAEIKAGVIWIAGNAQSTSIAGGLTVSWDAVWQRYMLDASYAYSKSSLLVAPPSTQSPVPINSIDDLRRENSLTARLWHVTPRFDQWLIRRNAAGDTSIYLLGNIGSDFAAGKKLFGGFQVGVSRVLFKSGPHALVGELGYDFTYLDPYVGPGFSIHSLRAALNYTFELSKTTKVKAGVEYLVNLARESGAPNDESPFDSVPAFQDHRLNGLVGLTTQLYDRLALTLSWTGRFDAKPQYITLPPNTVPANGRGVFLNKFDSVTQVQFVYTLG
jgi:putative salt-induced outer membrane protein YdiY